ncbi:MAG: hypothetical protein IKT01_01195 [Eubacteriaceae bacterium]|nr:hypothetical protein [Eubacteriaceae bacterium]
MDRIKRYITMLLVPISIQLVLSVFHQMAAYGGNAAYSRSIDILFAVAGVFCVIYLVAEKSFTSHSKIYLAVGVVIFAVAGVISLAVGRNAGSAYPMDYVIALHPVLTFAIICLTAGKGVMGTCASVIYALLVCFVVNCISYGALFCVMLVIMIVLCISVKNDIFGKKDKALQYAMVILPITYLLVKRAYTIAGPQVVFANGEGFLASKLPAIWEVIKSISYIGGGAAISAPAKTVLADYALLFYLYNWGWAGAAILAVLLILPAYSFYQMIKLVNGYEGRVFSLAIILTLALRVLAELPVTFGLLWTENTMALPFIFSSAGNITYAVLLAIWLYMVVSGAPLIAVKRRSYSRNAVPERTFKTVLNEYYTELVNRLDQKKAEKKGSRSAEKSFEDKAGQEK